MDFKRQLDIFNPELFQSTSVGVIGCGGIGSATVIILAKLGIENIEVWDHDMVEEHNIPSQFLPPKAGTKKVFALQEAVEYLTGLKIKAHPEKFTPDSLLGRLAPSIIVMAVDHMDVRKMIYNTTQSAIGVEFIVDGRMSGESYTIVAENGLTYMDSWHEHVGELKCTEKAIIYNTMSIGSDIANIVKRTLCRQPVPKCTKVDMREFVKLTAENYKWLIHRKQ